MEIIFIPKDTADDLMNLSIDEIESDELDEIKNELNEIDASYSLKEVNLGEGSDWVFILAVINSITTVLLFGDKIDKGIEGWIKLGKRLKKIFSKSDKVYFDIKAAEILALEHLSNKYEIKTIRLVAESEISFKDLSKLLLDREKNQFVSKPFSIYFITFEINDRLMVSLSVRSDGLISEIHIFDNEDQIPF
jgi:hypothetical protein